MNNLLKYILITTISFTIGNGVKAQNHVIGSSEIYKSEVRAFNIGFFQKNQYRQSSGFSMSYDTINIPSASVLAGDSIVMLTGDVKAFINFAYVSVDTNSASSAYTSGSTDTVFMYSRAYTNFVKIGYLTDTTFKETNPISANVSPSCVTEADSCLYWLKIPAGKWSGGTNDYILHYWYTKIED